MFAAPTVCRHSGCRAPNVRGSRFCEAHQENNSVLEARRNRPRDAIDRLYGTIRWLRFRDLILRHRPICQKLVRGQQCSNPARIIHHLISPRVDISKFVDPKNVLALCETCHTPEEGTPHWRAGVDYVDSSPEMPQVA